MKNTIAFFERIPCDLSQTEVNDLITTFGLKGAKLIHSSCNVKLVRNFFEILKRNDYSWPIRMPLLIDYIYNINIGNIDVLKPEEWSSEESHFLRYGYLAFYRMMLKLIKVDDDFMSSFFCYRINIDEYYAKEPYYFSNWNSLLFEGDEYSARRMFEMRMNLPVSASLVFTENTRHRYLRLRADSSVDFMKRKALTTLEKASSRHSHSDST